MTASELPQTAPESPQPGWDEAQIGRYQFRRLVGAGGMGVVVAAHDPDLQRDVAIKLVVTGDDDRPLREAQAMARLSHPNVVQVYEVIRLGTRTALVMELVEGEELRAWQKGRPWREIVDAYVQASRGLAAAHRAGIVHRDFKPSNVLVSRDGGVRVTDFGLARSAATDVEATGMVGTPAYMAPEQHRGGALDPRTDQWGLACALYEALHGRRPFASAEATGLADAVSRGAIEDEPVDSPVPRRVRAAIRRALSPAPDDRFPGIDEFARALAPPSRRGWVVLAAAAVALASLAVIAALVRPGQRAAACQGLGRPVQALWTSAARADLRTRLLAPTIAVPAATVERVLRDLDGYADAWASARTGACMDTRQGVRSAATLDQRMQCLDGRLSELSGLLDGVASGDARALRATSDAVAGLRPVARCADPPGPPRPTGGAQAGELAAGEDALARARAALSLGQFERALPLAERAITAGEQAGDQALTAAALVVRGECEDRLDRDPAALTTYQRAAKVAAQARDQELVADALSRAFLVEGNHLGRRGDALRARPFIELALDSAGQPDAVRAQWLHFLAILLYPDPSTLEEAWTHERTSLAIRQRTLPAGHLYIVDSMETLANIEATRKNFAEAHRLLTEVLQARVASRGPADALVSSAYNNLGGLEIHRGDLLAAVGHLQRALDVAAASGQPSTTAAYNLGLAQLDLGRWHAAADSFARALALSEQLAGAESSQAAEDAVFLGVALHAAGEVSRGRVLLQRGVDGTRRAGSPLLTTALSHAARLALLDGDRARARALLDEALTLPASNAPLRALVAAQLLRAEAGCAAARPQLASTLAAAIVDAQRQTISLATVELAECEAAAGEVASARQRLEAELAWLESAGADERARARARAALAALPGR